MTLSKTNAAGATTNLRIGGQPAAISVLDIEAARRVWNELDAGDNMRSPYQQYDLLAAWQRRVGSRSGVEPFIVVSHDPQGRPQFLWPLGRSTKWPLHLIHFLGGKHMSFNIGLWRRDVAMNARAQELTDILAALACAHRADLMTLFRQPFVWRGIANPFALLSHQDSAIACSKLTIDGAAPDLIKQVIGSAMRGRLRTKERRLQKLPGYRYAVARTPADVNRLLDRFFVLKIAHMKEQGLPNVFAEDGVDAFLREACTSGLAEGHQPVELHVLECDEEMLALFGACRDGERLSLMFNTYTQSEHGKQSPGLILLLHVLESCTERGFAAFDLGVGAAHYKSLFCKEPEPLFDSVLAMSPIGRLAAHGIGAALGAKRVVKSTPVLWDIVQFVRRLRAQEHGT